MGVDIVVLVSGVLVLGAGIIVLVAGVLVLGADIIALDSGVLVLGADIIVLASGRMSAVVITTAEGGVKLGVVNHVRRLEAGWCGRVFGGTRSHRGVERRIIGGFREVDQGRA